MSQDKRPPVLPQSLINLIGEYGMARTDGINELDRLARWEELISGIKAYALAAIEMQASHSAAWNYETMGLPNEEVAEMWRKSGHGGVVPYSFANVIQERMQEVAWPSHSAAADAVPVAWPDIIRAALKSAELGMGSYGRKYDGAALADALNTALDAHPSPTTAPAATTSAASEGSIDTPEFRNLISSMKRYPQAEGCVLTLIAHINAYTAAQVEHAYTRGRLAAIDTYSEDIKAGIAAQVAASKPAAPSRDTIRTVFMANGFTIKEGQTDLKDYVYRAAEALFGKPAAASGGAALRANLIEAAAILRKYEAYHRAKNTDDSNAKAEVNAELANRFETTIAASSTPQHQAQAGGDGKVLVPMILTSAMQRVLDEEDWQWEDLLAAAEAITPEQYNEIGHAPSPESTAKPVDERAAFEEWFKGRSDFSDEGYLSRHIDNNANYQNIAVQTEWSAWNARAGLASQPVPATPPSQAPALPAKQHHDDFCVDQFAKYMKEKMAAARAKGRSGWDDPEQCSVPYLQKLLHEHIQKGDPIDVANFCMMLYHYKASTALPATGEALTDAQRKLEWSAPAAPNHEIPYHHVIAQTPFGRILITWKDWKENPGYAIDEHPLADTVYWTGHDLEHTKAQAEEQYFEAIIAALKGGTK